MSITLTRRDFLQSLPALTAPLWPAWQPRLAFAPAQTAPRGDVLVVIFLRGAADVLNMVVPHGEAAYYAARPTLSLARPDDARAAAAQRVVDLDGFFGLHPALGGLLPAWQAGHLAVVHACGAPDESRSHFRAMELMERGVADERGPASGWISRHLAAARRDPESPLRAVGFGATLPRSLAGGVPAAALRSITDFHLAGDPRAGEHLRAALGALYAADPALAVIGQETLALLKTLEGLDPAAYRPANAARYPESEFGLALRQIALLIKAEVGLEVAAVDLGGWDTHFAQGGAAGLMAGLLRDLGDGLAALHADLFDQAGRLTVVVMSEFGRRLAENASLGTDHGHGSALFLVGGHVAGGRVHGRWPGLAEGQLVGPGDLAVTTDYRAVLADLLRQRLNNPAVDQIFPGFTPTPGAWFR